VPVPPVDVAVAEPVEPPLHATLVCDDIEAATTVGCVIALEAVCVHPLASVTVTVYVPTARPVAVALVLALFQVYVYGETPPDGTAVNVPLASPLHVTVTLVKVGITIAVGCVIVTLAVDVQPFASVAVTP
jgi:hypothetical protein